MLIKVSQISLFQLIFTDFVPCEQRPFNLPRGSWLRMAKLENSVPIFSKTHFHFLKTQLAFLISENISKCKSESPRQPPRHQVKIILYKNQYFFISWTDFLVNNRQPSTVKCSKIQPSTVIVRKNYPSNVQGKTPLRPSMNDVERPWRLGWRPGSSRRSAIYQPFHNHGFTKLLMFFVLSCTLFCLSLPVNFTVFHTEWICFSAPALFK